LETGNSNVALQDGSTVVTGTFVKTATFGKGADQVTLKSDGNKDVFIAKYSNSSDM